MAQVKIYFREKKNIYFNSLKNLQTTHYLFIIYIAESEQLKSTLTYHICYYKI